MDKHSGSAADSHITVGDVLSVGSWQLTLIAGEGGLDRRVEWAHVFDIPDPSGWLDGGELALMTGRNWPKSAAAQTTLIQDLHDAGASALGLGSLTPPLTNQAVARAMALNFPLLRVPRETGYLPIVKFVAAANGGSLQKNLANSLRVFESLSPTFEEVDTATRFQHLERITGYRLTIVSRLGNALFHGLESLPTALMIDVRKTMANTGKWKSLAIPDGFASPLKVGERHAGFIVAQDREEVSSPSFSVFRAVETVARLEVGALYRERESIRRLRAERLSRNLFLGGSSIAGQSEGDSDVPTSLVLAVIKTDASAPVRADSEIYHGLADDHVWNLLVEDHDRILVVLESADLGRLSGVTRDLRTQIGVSNEFGSLADSPLALRQASWALEYGQPVGEDGKLRSYSRENENWAQWLPSDPMALVQLVNQTLGDLLEYDRLRNSDLILSLRIYFEEDCKIQMAADRMFIHKHTLAYRLKRIEALTGRDINSVSDRSVLWLATSALSVVSMFPEVNELLK